MAGILDFLQSPDAQLGIGLLAAGGPTTDPNQTGLGQRLNGAMQSVRDVQNQGLRNKLLQSQIDENAGQAAMRAQQLAMAQRQMSIQNQLLGYGDQPTGAMPSTTAASSGVMPTSGAAPTSTAAPIGGGMGGAPGAPPQQSTLDALSAQYKIPPEALKYDLVFNGGKGIADLIAKRGMPDMQVTNGYVYDKNKVQPGFLPSLSTSQDGKTSMVQIGPDGQPVVSAPRGAVDTATDYARAAAGLKPIKYYDPISKTERYTNEAALATGGNSGSTVPAPPGLPQPYMNAVVATESGGNPNAVSPKGAQGTMQVMPATNSSPGFGVTPAQNNGEAERTRVGADYLKAMNDRYKDPTLAAIAYNWGPGNTDMWLKGGGDFNKLPTETKNYVASVMTRTAVNGMQGAPAGGYAAGPSAADSASQAANASFQKEGMTSANTYRDALNSRVDEGSNLNMRLQESVKALQLFQTGGGKETRAQVAQIAQALNMPDKVVNGIAGGDLGSMQEFNKLAVQQAMEQLKQSMGGAGRIAQAEFKVFQANNPNLDTDPSAVKKIFDFNTKLYNRDLTEQKEMTSYIKDGGDPTQWRPTWSQRQQQLGYTNPALNAQKEAGPQGSTPTPGKSFQDFGYSTPADAIKDAQNAMMKNPAAKGEIMKRLQAMGVAMPGAQGSW